MLAILALSRHGSLDREALADLLWPDDYYDATRLRLRQEIHRLRRSLGTAESLLQTTSTEVALDRSLLTTDIDLLQKALHDPSLAGTCLAQLGDAVYERFLLGWDDPWVIAEREKADQKRSLVAKAYATSLFDDGCYEQALRFLMPLKRCYPTDESLNMLAVKATAELGSLTSAVAEYRSFHRSRQAADHRPREPEEAFSPLRFEVPAPITSLHGRARELDEIVRMLDPDSKVRLVTLTGPGGIGKTRLALEAASALRPLYCNRVAFVELSEALEPRGFLLSVASQIGLQVPNEVEPTRFICRSLPDAPILIVLDNLEQLLPGAAGDVLDLLQSAPNLRLLATSKVALKLIGEATIPIGSLPPLTEGKALLLEGLCRYRPLVASTLEADPYIDALAEVLDGYPLALRLAAIRLRAMSPEHLLRLIGDNADRLEGNATDLAERHRSLSASLGWSFSLLQPEDLAALESYVALPGGVTLTIAQLLVGDQSTDSLERLVDSGFISLDDHSPELRYRILNPVRDFVRSRSRCWPKIESVTMERYAAFLLDQPISPTLPLTRDLCDRLDNERENTERLLAWSLESQPDLAAQVLGHLWSFENARARQKEALHRIDALNGFAEDHRIVLAKVGLLIGLTRFESAMDCLDGQKSEPDDDELVAAFALERAELLFRLGHRRYEKERDRIREAVQRSSHPIAAARFHYQEGVWRYFRRDLEEAIVHLSEATRVLQANGDLAFGGRSSILLAMALSATGRKLDAQEAMRNARPMVTATCDPLKIAHLEEAEGRIALEGGRSIEAEHFFRKSLEIWSRVGSRFQIADQALSLTRSLLAQERYSEARASLLCSVEQWFLDNNWGGLCQSLSSAALIYARLGDRESASRVLSFSKAFETAQDTVLIKSEIDFRASVEAEVGPGAEDPGPYTPERAMEWFRKMPVP